MIIINIIYNILDILLYLNQSFKLKIYTIINHLILLFLIHLNIYINNLYFNMFPYVILIYLLMLNNLLNHLFYQYNILINEIIILNIWDHLIS